MPKKQEIEFTISPEGKVEFTVKGVKGSGCEEIAKAFEQVGEVEAREKTAEYYEKEDETYIRVRDKS